MKGLLEKFCNDKDRTNGLLLVDLPTGFGKTYTVAQYIAENYDKIDGKIIFVTQLKKNFPEDDLRKCFKALGKEDVLDEQMLIIENNVDNLCKNFGKVKEELKKYNICDKALLWRIEREITILNKEDLGEDALFLKQQAREDLQENSERELRNKVTAYLLRKEDGKERTKKERRDLVMSDPAYSWIAKLYPTVHAFDKQILIMSLDKFLLRFSTIVEPPFIIPESTEFLKNGVVFIDEFDSSKDVVLNRIIEDGLSNYIAVLELFRLIETRLNSDTKFTRKLLVESQRHSSKENWLSPAEIIDNFKDRANEIVNKYNLQFLHKLDDNKNSKASFLFQDYQTHTIVNDEKRRLIVKGDDERQINKINVIRNEDVNEEDDPLNRLINEINGYLKYFQTGIGFIAENYVDKKFENKEDVYNITYESAIRTALSEFGIEGRNQNYLTNNILCAFRRKNRAGWQKAEDAVDFSTYNTGFRYCNLIDSDFFDTQSRFNYVAFNDSPEKFLVRLMDRVKVVGVSATATIESALVNYDLKYLSKRWGKNISYPDDEDKKRIKEKFNELTKYYDRVNINCKPLGESVALSEKVKEIFERVCPLTTPNYKRTRLICFTQCVEQFFCNGEIKAFLYFSNAKLNEFDENGYNQYLTIFNDIRKLYGNNARLHFLTGSLETFDKHKSDMFESLKNGEKVFAVTTYASMGAGQNIHYEFPKTDCDEIIRVNDTDYSDDKKDFDAIYLEQPSNVLINFYNGFDCEQSFIKYIFQIKFLLEAGDLNAFEANKRIREAFAVQFGWNANRSGHPKNSRHFCLAYAKVILQAIGRICRTPNKSKNIYIFYQSGLEDKIVPVLDYFDDKLINPEYRAFLECCRNVGSEIAITPREEVLKISAASVMEKSKKRIDGLREDWQLNNIRNWEAIRDYVLKHPTLNNLEGVPFPELYIELPEEDNCYYQRENEFKLTEVSFRKVAGYNSVDEEEVMLPDILKIPGVREYFVDEGYAVEFKKARFMLAFNVLKQIYQGALGEIVGRFILDRKLLRGMDVQFKDMPEQLYEKFDNMIAEGFYIDFKLWKGTYDPSYKVQLKKIRSKLRAANPKKILYVNILKPNNMSVKPYMEASDDPILSIPYLYDVQNKTWNVEGLKKLYQVVLGNT